MRRTRLDALAEHPFELFFGVFFVLAGGALAFGDIAPTSVNALLPEVVVRLWGGLQLMAGLLIVIGFALRHGRPDLFLLSLRIERPGQAAMSVALIVYAVTATMYAGSRASYAVGFYVVLALACGARAYATLRMERRIRRNGGAGAGA